MEVVPEGGICTFLIKENIIIHTNRNCETGILLLLVAALTE